MPQGLQSFREPVTRPGMKDYQRLREDRPYKYDQRAADYRKALAGEPRCDGCMHFFMRVLDGFHVCEVVRPVPEKPIMPEWTCRFQTPDLENYPLYK